MPSETTHLSKPTQRFRIRFSLRSLLICSLLCGASMLFRENFGSWEKVRIVQETGEIRPWPKIDPDDRLHFILDRHIPNGRSDITHVVCDLNSGANAVESSASWLNVREKTGCVHLSFVESKSSEPNYFQQTCDYLKVGHLVTTRFPLERELGGKDVFCLVPSMTSLIVFTVKKHASTRLAKHASFEPTFDIWKRRSTKLESCFGYPECWGVTILFGLFIWSVVRDWTQFR